MWTDRPLGDHIGTLSGFAFSSDYFNDSGEGLPLIRIRDIDSTETVVHYSGPYPPAFVVSAGDILVGMDGEFNLKRWQGDKALLNQRVLKVFAKPGGEIDLGFAYYWLAPFLKKVEAATAATTVKHLSSKDVERAVVRSPDKDTQVVIANILRALDTQIEATEGLIAKQERVRAGLMQDLFTRGLDEHGKLRPPRDQAPHLYHQTELGWLPLGWEAPELESLLAPVPTPMRSGPFGSALLKHELVDSGVPFLGIDNIHVEHFKSDFIRFVTPRKFSELSRYRVLPNDVVITIMGTVGRCCVIPDGFGEMLSSKHLWTMTFDQSKVLPKLVCWQMCHAPWVHSHFRAKSQGGIMDAIQSSTLKQMRLPKPTLPEQQQILAAYEVATSHLKQMREECAKLGLQKSGLMQDLLTGKVSVATLLESATA
jgi:type I restriction enzyme, S subunit